MTKVMAAACLALLIAFGGAAHAGSSQEDSFLTAYYADNTVVRCRDYQTANGSRFATYQWWLLGFVSGASHVSTGMKRPLARVDVARALSLASDHCRAKPMDPLEAAAAATVAKLASTK